MEGCDISTDKGIKFCAIFVLHGFSFDIRGGYKIEDIQSVLFWKKKNESSDKNRDSWLKHYTEYTMATNRLKVEKKKEKKEKERWKLVLFSPLVCRRTFRTYILAPFLLFEKWLFKNRPIRSTSGCIFNDKCVNGAEGSACIVYGKYDKWQSVY